VQAIAPFEQVRGPNRLGPQIAAGVHAFLAAGLLVLTEVVV